MNETESWTTRWFPNRRFDADFPLVLWFTGLWFYLKSFLYLCYLYMFGLESQPLPTDLLIEAGYFGLMIIPSLFLGMAMWNDKRGYIVPAIAFLGLDTPLLVFHVLRLGEAGYLDAGLGLTNVLEIGSLALNVISFSWLMGSYSRLCGEPGRKTLS
jgi:hypothetical protein